MSQRGLPSAAGIPIAGLFELLGSADPQRFPPGQSRWTLGGAVGSRILRCDFDSAAAPDYARARLPNSCATAKGFRNAGKPVPGIMPAAMRGAAIPRCIDRVVRKTKIHKLRASLCRLGRETQR